MSEAFRQRGTCKVVLGNPSVRIFEYTLRAADGACLISSFDVEGLLLSSGRLIAVEGHDPPGSSVLAWVRVCRVIFDRWVGERALLGDEISQAVRDEVICQP